MSLEHDHTQTSATATPAVSADDLAPGRANAANQLVSPDRPLVSALVQRKERDGNGVAEGADAAVSQASSSSGQSLPGTLMRKFESSLGADLSDVRVHTGTDSQVAANAVGAKAYTVGNDIHFGAGHYSPTSSAGEHLLAHEVAHTVQQSGGGAMRKAQFKLEVSTPGDHLEVEADRAADAMIVGGQASVSGAMGLARKIMRDKDQDVDHAPEAPSFSQADGSFAAMITALNSSMKGGGTSLTTPSGIAASTSNLSACEEHARRSEVYYKNNSHSWDPGDMKEALGATAAGDMSWAAGMRADVGIAASATNTWISLANQSNTSWDVVTKIAESMSIQIDNKVETDPFTQQKKQGDQQVSDVEVGGEGMSMATAAKKAGVVKSPDATGLQAATADYNKQRDDMANKERRVFSQLNAAKINAITKKKDAAKEEKEKWEAIAKAAEAFETGVTVAITAGGAVEGEMGKATVLDPGGKSVVVVEKEGKKGFGIQDNSAENIIKQQELEAGKVAEKASGFIGKAIAFKIAQITKQIGVYDGQIQSYKDVQGVQDSKAIMGDYMDGLGNLSKAAAKVESERDLMEKKLIEWGKQIDQGLNEKNHVPKGSPNETKDNARAAQLLAKIRIASTACGAAIEGLSQGSGGLPKLYAGLAKDAAAKVAKEGGRGDKRAAVFGIESRRWTQASSAIGQASAALTRRQTQLDGLEKSFLAQFGANNGGIDAPSSPGTKY